MRIVAVGAAAACAPSGPPRRRAFRHGNAFSADRRRVFAKTTNKPCRAPTPSRVSLGGAARVVYTRHVSRTRVDRGEGASGAFTRANTGHASRSPARFSSSSGFSPSETPERTSSSEHTQSRHAHPARRVALALAVIALVAFAVVEACGARASFPPGATGESFTRSAVATLETLRPGGLVLPPFAEALLRDARTLLDTSSPSLVIALMAFLTVNPAPLRRASRETFNALARCLAARDAPNWLTAATALSGEFFFIFVWAISLTSCFVNRRIRRPSYAAVCLLGAGE